MPTKPTKTEQLLYGSKKGATDLRNPFRLERDLPQYYEKMHQTVKEVVDNLRNPDFNPWSYGCSIGVGWFVLGCGQGPILLWTEDEGYVDEDDLDMEDEDE